MGHTSSLAGPLSAAQHVTACCLCISLQEWVVPSNLAISTSPKWLAWRSVALDLFTSNAEVYLQQPAWSCHDEHMAAAIDPHRFGTRPSTICHAIA